MIFFLLILLYACNSKQDKILKLDDLVLGSKGKVITKDTARNQVDTKPITYFISLLCDSLQIDHASVAIDSTFMFPERFHPIKTDKVIFKQTELIAYKHLQWSDSIRANQAFFNWLDQFGERKKSLVVGDQINVMKPGFLLLLQDKSIVYLEFGRTFKPEYLLHKLTNCGFGRHWKYVLYQQPQKKTVWIDCSTDTTNCPLYNKELLKLSKINIKK